MQQVDQREFGRRTAEGRPCNHYDFSLYYGERFSCACGAEHDLKPWMEIVSELPLFRFIVTCPDRNHMTVLKARWNQDSGRPKLESEIGTHRTDPGESVSGIEFQAGLLEGRTGRRWSREETAAFMEHRRGRNRNRGDR